MLTLITIEVDLVVAVRSVSLINVMVDLFIVVEDIKEVVIDVGMMDIRAVDLQVVVIGVVCQEVNIYAEIVDELLSVVIVAQKDVDIKVFHVYSNAHQMNVIVKMVEKHTSWSSNDDNIVLVVIAVESNLLNVVIKDHKMVSIKIVAMVDVDKEHTEKSNGVAFQVLPVMEKGSISVHTSDRDLVKVIEIMV